MRWIPVRRKFHRDESLSSPALTGGCRESSLSNIGLHCRANDRISVGFQEVTQSLQLPGEGSDLFHVSVVIREAGPQVDVPARQHAELAKKRAIIVGRGYRDVLVLTDRHLGKSVRGTISVSYTHLTLPTILRV